MWTQEFVLKALSIGLFIILRSRSTVRHAYCHSVRRISASLGRHWLGGFPPCWTLCSIGPRGHNHYSFTPEKTPTQEGVDVIPVRWAKLPMAFTRSYGKSAIKALKKFAFKKPVDIINAHLPLVSWKRKEFRWLEQNIAPVVSCLHGSWLGEKEGVKRLLRPRNRLPGRIQMTLQF